MERLKRADNVFVISVDDLQIEAREKIGRELTEEEILVAKKKLEWGLYTGIDIIYSTIFREMT